MIYEMRTYQVQLHKGTEFLKVYEENALPIITKYAKLVGCWEKETGTLNSIVFLWAYDDFNHRMVQRAKLWHSREWLEVVPTFRPYLVHQESVFLLPAAFSPLR